MTALTSKQRQDIRRVQLAQAAKEAGFPTWSAMMTAIAKGTHIVVDKSQYSTIKDIYEISMTKTWSKNYLKEKKRIDDLYNQA